MSGTTHPDPRPGQGPTRRRLLCSGGLAAAGLAASAGLSACGGSGDASPVQAESDGAFRVPQDDTAVGASTYYSDAGTRFIVTQPTEGDWRAFDAVCPHEGCMTSDTDREGNLVCPCHSSVFDPGTGEPISGPAQNGLTQLDVETDGQDLLIRG